MRQFLTRINKSLVEMLLHAPIPYYPFMFGALLFIFGLWIVMPWDVYAHARAWSWIAQFIPEFYLGAVGMLCGFLLLVGAIAHHPRISMVGMLASFYYWGFLGVSFSLGNPDSPVIVVAFWICIMSGLAWVNRKVRQNLLFEE